MKGFFLALAAVMTLGFAQQAEAQAPWDAIRYTIGGNNLYQHDDYNTCSNYYYQFPFGTFTSSSCPYMSISVGYILGGGECCAYCGAPCLTDEGKQEFLDTHKSNIEAGLEDIFASNQTVNYWGYNGTTIRSPNAGRTVAAKAKLDACLFYSDTDAIDALGGSDADKYSYCAGSTYGCGSTMKNEHCQANGAAVCIDRCACTYANNGVDTCNGL